MCVGKCKHFPNAFLHQGRSYNVHTDARGYNLPAKAWVLLDKLSKLCPTWWTLWLPFVHPKKSWLRPCSFVTRCLLFAFAQKPGHIWQNYEPSCFANMNSKRGVQLNHWTTAPNDTGPCAPWTQAEDCVNGEHCTLARRVGLCLFWGKKKTIVCFWNGQK